MILDLLKSLVPRRAPPKERRRFRRLPCKLMAEIRTEKGAFGGAIVDLSVAGFRVNDLQQRLKAKALVAVGLPASTKRGIVKCRVSWVRTLSGSFCAGLVLEDSEEAKNQSWLRESMTAAGFTKDNIKERRAHIRVTGHQLAAFLTNQSDTIIGDGSLINLGRGGAMFSCEHEIPVGTKCNVCLDPVGGRPSVQVGAVIVTILRLPSNRKTLHGIQFNHVGDRSVDRLINSLFNK